MMDMFLAGSAGFSACYFSKTVCHAGFYGRRRYLLGVCNRRIKVAEDRPVRHASTAGDGRLGDLDTLGTKSSDGCPDSLQRRVATRCRSMPSARHLAAMQVQSVELPTDRRFATSTLRGGGGQTT